MPRPPCFAALLVLGCTAAADPTPPAGYPHAIATNDCGPADGPAVVVYLAPTPIDSPALLPSAPFVQISVWQPLRALGDTTIDLGPTSDQGHASACRAADDCESARSARVRIGATAGMDTLTGEVELGFAGAGRVRGSFRAPWRPRQTLCG